MKKRVLTHGMKESSAVNTIAMSAIPVPLPVFVRHIAPYAFEDLSGALNVMLVCRRVYEVAMGEIWFWDTFLRIHARKLQALDEAFESFKYYGTLWQKEAMARLGFSAWDSICAACRPPPARYRSVSETLCHFAWEEGSLIEGRWCTGDVKQAIVWTFCGVVEACYDDDGCWGGLCRILWNCGLEYEGEFRRWRRQGEGTFRLVDGTLIQGIWDKDYCANATLTWRGREYGHVSVAPGPVTFGIELKYAYLIVVSNDLEKMMITQLRGVLEPYDSDNDRYL